MYRRTLFALVATFYASAAAFAVPTVNATNAGGVWNLLPNTPGQVITVIVTGGDEISGVDLSLQVGDGTTGPIITGADLFKANDLIFFPNNTATQGDAVAFPTGFMFSGISTATGTIPASGNLGHVTISTVGINSGDFVLSLFGDQLGLPTDLPPFDDIGGPLPNLIDGMIHITQVPEPGTMVLGLFAAAGLCAVVIRRRRKSA